MSDAAISMHKRKFTGVNSYIRKKPQINTLLKALKKEGQNKLQGTRKKQEVATIKMNINRIENS